MRRGVNPENEDGRFFPSFLLYFWIFRSRRIKLDINAGLVKTRKNKYCSWKPLQTLIKSKDVIFSLESFFLHSRAFSYDQKTLRWVHHYFGWVDKNLLSWYWLDWWWGSHATFFFFLWRKGCNIDRAGLIWQDWRFIGTDILWDVVELVGFAHNRRWKETNSRYKLRHCIKCF